jgi:TP901 family phage tail tape measure protein
MADIADMTVSAGWEGADAESGLERLGQKFDKTTGRLRDASGRFVALKKDADGATASLSDHGAKLDVLGAKLQGAGTQARQLGVSLTAGITLPLAALATYIVMTGSKTSQALNQFQGSSRATVAEMERVRAKAKELGADLALPGTSAGQAAQAMLELNKGGLSIEESMNAARGAIQLARAAMVSEAEAANTAANTLNTFGLAGDQAGRVADVLANAANKSTGDIGDFAQGLAQAGMVAKASNVSLEQTTAVLALLANNGMKGSDAGTSLKTFLLSLRGPSQDARKAIEALSKTTGIDVSPYDKLTGRLKPLPDIVDNFSRALKGIKDESRDALLDKVFGSDGARVAIALFGKGRAELESYEKAMGEAGTAQRVAEANTRGLTGAWDALMSTVSTFADSIFEDMEEPLTQVVQAIGTAVSWLQGVWDSLGPGAKIVVGALASVVAAAGPVLVVIGSVVAAVGGLVTAISSIAGGVAALGGLSVALPIVAAVAAGLLSIALQAATMAAAVGVAAYAVYQTFRQNFGGLRDISLRAWAAIKEHTLAALNVVSEAWGRIYPTLASLTQKVLGLVVAYWEMTSKRILDIVVVAFNAVAPVVRRVASQVFDMVEAVLKVIDGDWQGAWAAFSRFTLKAVENFTDIFGRLPEVATAILGRLILAIINLGSKMQEAAAQLVLRFVVGFAVALMDAKDLFTQALADALVMAALGVDAGGIASVLMARFIGGMTGAAKAAAANADTSTSPANWGAADGPWGEHPEAAGGGKTLNFGGGGKGGGGGDNGESALMKSLKLQLAALNEAAKVAENIYQRRADDEQFYYDNGYKAASSYYSMLQTLENERFASLYAAGEKEVTIAEQTAEKLVAASRKVKDPLKRENVLKEAANVAAEANNKLDQIASQHEQNLTKIQRDGWKTRIEEGRTSWANETQRLETYASAQAEIYRTLADRGVMTFAAAQRVIASSQMELLIREQKRLENELKGLDPDSGKAKDLRGQLDVQNLRVENYKATDPYNAAADARRDIEREASRASELRSIRDSVTDMERESQADRRRILESAGVRREELWRRQMAFELTGEALSSARRVAELRREIELTEKLEGNEQHKAALIRGYNAQIEAEERRSAQRRSNIVEDFYQKQDERLRSYVDKAVGTLRKAMDAYREEGWGGFFKSLAEDFRNALLQMAEDLLKSRLLQLLRNIWKIPAPGSTQGAGNQGGDANSGSADFLDFFKQLLHIGGGGKDASAVSTAGDAMRDAIEQGGQKAADVTTKAGENQAGSIRGVGISIVSALAAIGSQLAAGAGRSSFWKGLLFAAASGAISGAAGAWGQGLGGGGSTVGSQAGVGAPQLPAPTFPTVPLPSPGTLAFADGGMLKAMAGGRLILAGEAGFDELIVSTDPKHRGRTAALLEQFIARTGITPRSSLPKFEAGGFTGTGPAWFASDYVPPSSTSSYSTTHNRNINLGGVHVTVNSNGEMTPQQAKKTGRQIARATTGALRHYAA